MENPITCRQMTEEDIPQVLAIGKATDNFEVSENDGFWPEPILRRWLTTSDDPLIGACDQDQVVGFILGAIHHPIRKTTLKIL